MNNRIRIRYIETDYLFNKVRSQTQYITDEQIRNMLDLLPSTDDLTFIFTPHQTGFSTLIEDNKTGQHVTLDELNKFAYDFYLKQVKKLSVQRSISEMNNTNIHRQKFLIIMEGWRKERENRKKHIASY